MNTYNSNNFQMRGPPLIIYSIINHKELHSKHQEEKDYDYFCFINLALFNSYCCLL